MVTEVLRSYCSAAGALGSTARMRMRGSVSLAMSGLLRFGPRGSVIRCSFWNCRFVSCFERGQLQALHLPMLCVVRRHGSFIQMLLWVFLKPLCSCQHERSHYHLQNSQSHPGMLCKGRLDRGRDAQQGLLGNSSFMSKDHP